MASPNPPLDARLTAWLEQRWYQGVQPEPWLRGLSALFGRLVAWRQQRYASGRSRSWRLPVPVLVVGNINIGGVGKTPLVIALCEALRSRGWRPGVVSRGYARRDTAPRRLTAHSSADEVGDEPRLIAARSGSPVAVAAKRHEAAELLLVDGEVDLIISDDGLQHYALQRDVEIAVVDARRGLGNGRVLPAGPLREPPQRLQSCDHVVCNGGGSIAGVSIEAIPMHLRLDEAVCLSDGHRRPLSAWQGKDVQAVAGIGNPQRFFDALREHGLQPVEHVFADHYDFGLTDFDFDDGRPLLMTEKDAVKCAEFAASHWYAVPVRAELPASWFDTLSAQLRAAQDQLHAQ